MILYERVLNYKKKDRKLYHTPEALDLGFQELYLVYPYKPEISQNYNEKNHTA